MIAEIRKGNTCRAFVEYNENKVNKGVARRLTINPNLRNAKTIKEYLNMSMQTNKRVKKNKFQHVMISFHKDDHIDQSAFEKIWDRYAEEMGFNSCDKVVYEHNDTHLRHYHIVMPTVDFSGNKVADYRDFTRNRDICRMLEKEFQIHEIEYDELQIKKEGGQKASNYSIHKFVKSTEFKENHSGLIPISLANSILKYNLSNQQVRENYPGFSEIQFKKLLTLSKDAVKNYKKELISKLRVLRDNHSDYIDFEASMKKEGLYVRRIKSQEGWRLIYGDPANTTYIKDSKIPKDLRFPYLYEKDKGLTLEDQKRFIKNIALRSVKKCTSWNQFVKLLDDYNIDVHTQTNKNGVYAYSLQSRNVKDSIAIPASQVDQRLTVGKLNKQFDGGISIAMPAMSESKPTTPQTNSVQSKQVLREASNQMDHSQEAIADEIRKNKLKAEAQEEEIDRASY